MQLSFVSLQPLHLMRLQFAQCEAPPEWSLLSLPLSLAPLSSPGPADGDFVLSYKVCRLPESFLSYTAATNRRGGEGGRGKGDRVTDDESPESHPVAPTPAAVRGGTRGPGRVTGGQATWGNFTLAPPRRLTSPQKGKWR